MKYSSLKCIALSVFITVLSGTVFSQIYISPLKSKRGFSGVYGEIRQGHLHSGLDFRVERVGEPVYAIASGYIERISIRPDGFGMAVYVAHPSLKQTSVYAHLDNFAPNVAKYVKQQQYERKSFPLDLYLSSDMFPITQGDVVGYAGNTGTSGGPHLHFETRHRSSQTPFNPFTYNVVRKPNDKVFPIFRKIFTYTQYPFEDIYITKKQLVATAIPLGHGKFRLPKDTLYIPAKTYFGFDVLDYLLAGADIRTGVYGLRMLVNEENIFEYRVDEFAFSQTRYTNFLIDFEEKQKNNINVVQTYRLKNNLLSIYLNRDNDGIINLPVGSTAKVEVSLWDHVKNKSTLNFFIKIRPSPALPPIPNKYIKMYPSSFGRYSDKELAVEIPSETLYEPILFTMRKLENTILKTTVLSSVYQIHTTDVPLHKNITVQFKNVVTSADKSEKVAVCQLLPNGQFVTLPTTYNFKSKTAIAKIESFGTYFVGIDTVPPVITAINCRPNENMQRKYSVMLRVKDDVGGIKNYEGTVDDKWALFEYDRKNNMFIYRFDATYLSRNRNHKLVFKASDGNGNQSVFTTTFYW